MRNLQELKFILLFILALTAGPDLHAQADLRKVPLSSLPGELKSLEHVSMAFRWTDTLGDNVVVVSKRMVKRDDEDRIRTKGRLRSYNKQADRFSMQVTPSFASRYRIIADSGILVWKVGGISRNCPDEGMDHTKNSTVFTDLDGNSKMEIWLIYKAECLEDPRGGDMKIVMCEGTNRYTMNGKIINNYSGQDHEEAFRTWPQAFRKYAMKLWQQFGKAMKNEK